MVYDFYIEWEFHHILKLLQKNLHILLFISSLEIWITCRLEDAKRRRETKASYQIDVSAIIWYGSSNLPSFQRHDLRGEGMASLQHCSLYKITRRGPQVSIVRIILWHRKLLLTSVCDQYPFFFIINSTKSIGIRSAI